MPLPASRFLEPATLAGIHDLHLLAKTVVEGFLVGRHLDPRPGVGVEFNQYRSYQPGDDLRRVDWRVYARSDRFFVRESEVERDVTVRFLLDASASMSHSPENGVGKFDYARFLIAALAYLVDRQGDRLAFQAIRGGGAVELGGGRRRALLELLGLLERIEPAGRWPPWDELAGRLGAPRRRELVVLVTDLWERRSEISGAARKLAAAGHEVLVLHLLGRDELDFPYRGDVELEDLETGRRVEGSAEAMRGGYRRALAAQLGSWRRDLLEAGVAYELLPTDRPLDRALRSFLARRLRLA